MSSVLCAICGGLYAVPSLAMDDAAGHGQIFLQRIVAVDGEATYSDPLVLNTSERAARTPENLIDAAYTLTAIVPTKFDASSKIQAAELCGFSSSGKWSRDFVKCGDLVCTSLPATSQDAGCGYLIRVNEWVEENWLGGLCRIVATNREESSLFRWFSGRNLTQCHQMSELVVAAFYRHVAGLPLNESSLIDAAR